MRFSLGYLDASKFSLYFLFASACNYHHLVARGFFWDMKIPCSPGLNTCLPFLRLIRMVDLSVTM